MPHDQPNWPDAIAGRIFPDGVPLSGHANPYRLALELVPCPVLLSNLEGLTVEWGNISAADFLQIESADLGEFVLADFVPERELAKFWQSLSELQKGIRTTASTLLSAEDGMGICRVELVLSKEHLIAIGQGARTNSSAPAIPTDALTGLPDRRVLRLRIEDALHRKHQNWGLLFVDLNDFKIVNDRFGHVVGDEVLRDFARKLQASSRPNDLVVRYGGDEFVVLVDRVPSEQELRAMARRITCEVIGQIDASNQPVRVTCSVGCAMAANHSTVEQLVSAADRDMYAQKHDTSK